MARFTAIDVYVIYEVLAETDDLNVAYSAALQRMKDTDGECAVVIQDSETVPVGGYMEYIAVDFYGEEDE